MRLTEAQIDVLTEMMKTRCQHGMYTMDRHYEATTFRSLRKRGLIGYYLPPRLWVATRYKITPLGRKTIAKAEGRP